MDALTPEQRHRRSEVLQLLRRRATSVSETEDGILFQWDGDQDLPPLVGEFVALESRCCPFVRFAMAVETDGGSVSLRLSGREGAKDFLRVTFLAQEAG